MATIGASSAADNPVRWGTETEIGATGGNPAAATPDCADPSTEVDGSTVPTPDSSPPGPNAGPVPGPVMRPNVPPVSVVSSVRTMTSSARDVRSRALSWSRDNARRRRISSVSAWPWDTLPRPSSSSGLKTR